MSRWGARHKVKIWPADKWFSLCVRLAANNLCENCGCPATDCAHIYGRRTMVTRWCKDNAIALCRTCHDSFGDEPARWIDFVDGKWPNRRLKLEVKKRGILKNTPAIRAMISAHYNKEFRRMERDADTQFESWN